MTAVFLPAFTLWRREVVRFLRQPNRVMGAVGSPLLFWFLLGSGVGRSFQAEGTAESGYLAYFFPGTLVMVLLFTAIFGTISIIEDRREGFLQSVLVAPVPRGVIVLGKTLGVSTLALGQVLCFLFLSPLAGIPIEAARFAGAAILLAVLALGLTGLGFFIAWRMHSIQGFHAVMNFLLLPMWVLSGALFPAAGASGWVRLLMLVNPLTYGIAGVRRLLLPEATAASTLPALPLCVTVSLLFAALSIAAASWAARGHVQEDLR